MESPGAKSASKLASAQDYGLLLLLSVIWGLAFVAIRELDGAIGFFDLTLLRWLIAAPAYLALLPFVGRAKSRFDKADIPRLLVMGLLNVAVYHFSLNYGEVTVPAGLAGLLITFGPVFSVLLSAAFLKERVGKRVVAALILALAGAAVLFAADLPTGVGLAGPLAVVIAALSYATFGLLSRPLVNKYGALHVAIWAGVVGTAMILPLVPTSLFSVVSHLSLGDWEALLYLSILSTVLGYSMFYTLIGRVGVSRLMIQLYLAPVISVIGGVLILGETFSVVTAVGGGLMFLAVWIATTKKKF